MAKLHYYKAFGLTISSCFDIPAFSTCPKGETDAIITSGEVPAALTNPVTKGVCFEASPNEFLFHHRNIGNALVKNGNYIIIQKSKKASPQNINNFISTILITALIQQRKILTLHGSAVLYKGKAVLFCGHSGHGKSTIAAAFNQKGFPVIADDLSAVTWHNQQAVVIPSFPKIKLWKDILHFFPEFNEQKESFHPEMNKFYINMADHFSAEPVPISHIFILKRHNKETFNLSKLQGIKKFEELKKNTFRMRFIEGFQLTDAHFKSASRLAGAIPISLIERPHGNKRAPEESYEKITTYLEQDGQT